MRNGRGGALVRKRLPILILVLFLIGLGVAYVLPRSHFVIMGWWNGEAFYRGLPASYWSGAFKKDPFIGPQGDVGKTLREGGQAAIPVLFQLLNDDDPDVRSQAALALSLIDCDPAALMPALLEFVKSGKEPKSFSSRLRLAADLSGRSRQTFAEELQEMLEAEREPERRAGIALVLGLLGLKNSTAALHIALQEGTASDREEAALALYRLGERDTGLSTLLELHAFQALGQIGSKDKDAVCPKLVELLKHPDPKVRGQAANTLGQIGPDEAAALALLKTLKDEDPNVRSSAASALRWRTPPLPNDVIPALLEALKDPEPAVQKVARNELVRLKCTDRGFLQTLTLSLRQEKNTELRLEAASALAIVAPQSPELVPTLVKFIGKDKSPDIRMQAASILQEIGLAAQGAVPTLMTVLKDDKSRTIRIVAMRALGEIARGDEPVPLLLSVLNDDHEAPLRAEAADTLGRIGIKAKKNAITALTKSLEDKSTLVQCRAAEALAQLDPQDRRGVAVMIHLLDSGDPSGWKDACLALGKMGPMAESAVPVLIDKLTRTEALDNFESVSDSAAWALGRIGPKAKSAVPALTVAVQGDYRLDSAAIEALGNMGPDAKSAVPILVKKLKSRPPWIQVRIAQALWKIDPRPDLAIPPLVGLLKEKDEWVPRSAAEALGEIGPPARSAVPALSEALKDRRPEVRQAAKKALNKIEGQEPR
jgi:HEAT repeat protein